MSYNDLPLITILIFLPMLGAFFISLARPGEAYEKNVARVALITSGATLFYALFIFLRVDFLSRRFPLLEIFDWIPSLNIQYFVGIDGVSIIFILLTTLLIFLALYTSLRHINYRLKEYCIALLLLETFIIGTFCAMDLFLFYIFFEGALIPMFFIIGIWGGKKRIYAAWKILLYTLVGSLLMLLAIIYLYFEFGTSGIYVLYQRSIPLDMQYWLWGAFFIAFSIKLPMFPVHTWLPSAHVEAPTAGSMLLAGVLLKMGGYGFFRILLPLFPDACVYFSDFVLILSCIAVVYASMIAFVQKDIKKLVAYSSIAHMGFVSAGFFTFTIQGMQGALFQMVSHGLVSAALFMCIGFLYERTKTRNIEDYGGLANIFPIFGALMMVCILGNMGFPGTSGFVGELLVLIGAYNSSIFIPIFLGLGIVLSAIYGLLLYRKIWFGPIKDTYKDLKPLTHNQRFSLIFLVVLIVIMGLYPQGIISLTESQSKRILERIIPKDKKIRKVYK